MGARWWTRLRGREVVAALVAVLVARTALNGGHRIAYPFLPEIARGLDVELTTLGDLFALRALSGLAAIVAPLLVARLGRRTLMGLAAGAGALGCVVVAVSGALGGAALVTVAIGLALTGAAKPLFDIPMQGWFGARIPQERRGRVLGLTELTWAGGLALAFPAGFLIAATSWSAAFWLVAALGAAGTLAVLVLMRPDRPAQHVVPARRVPAAVARLVVVVALFRIAAEQLFIVYGRWLEVDLGLATAAIGTFTLVVVAAEATGEGGVSAFADRLGLRRTVLAGLGISALAYASLGQVGSSLVAAVVVVVVWFAAFEVTIVATIPLVTVIAGASRERALAYVAVMSVGASGLAALIGPRVLAAGGIGLNGWLSAALVALAAGLLLTVPTDRTPASPSTTAPR